MLRPIGTRFWIHYPKSENSTDPHSHDHLCEVVAHAQTVRFIGDKDGPMAEEYKTIQIVEGIP